MDVCVLITAVIHLVVVSTALGGVIHQDLQPIGYVATSSVCDKVGQILINPDDACSYLVCDHTTGSSSAEHKLLARRMPCAPGTSVPPDYNKHSGSSNPCVHQVQGCNAPLTKPRRPHGKKGVDVGVPVQTGTIKTSNNRGYFPGEAIHMMNLVWNSIQDKFKQLDHRKSLKSHPRVKLDLEKHMADLQHLWERIRGLVGSMLQRKVRGAGKSELNDRRKPARSSREISGLKNLWMSMWEKIRELEALEVAYAGAEEPLGLGWEDGETPSDEKTRHHNREGYLERKRQQGKSVRYGSPKKYETNDISRFDSSEPEWDVYDMKKMYSHKDRRRHRPVYMDVEEDDERQDHGEDHGEGHGEGHRHRAEHEHYEAPSHHNNDPYTDDQYGDLYPDGNVPVVHQDEYSPRGEHRYLQGEHQEGIGTVHDPQHLEYRDGAENQGDNIEHQPGDYQAYDHKPDGTRQQSRDTMQRRMPENSGKSISSAYRESNNVEPERRDARAADRGGPPPPPLEAVDEQFDLSLVPSGYGNHMPLNTLWVQMKDVLTKMMQNNKKELKNIPSDEELKEMKRKDAHRRQYEQQKSGHRHQEQSPPEGRRHQEQSPPGGQRHQEQSPPGGAHRSQQVLSNRPPNFVNYGSARKAGSDRGPQHISKIKPVMTTPSAVTVKLPQNKREFEALKRKDSAVIDEQYEKAKKQWKKISQG